MLTFPHLTRPSRRFEYACHFGIDDVSHWHFARCLASDLGQSDAHPDIFGYVTHATDPQVSALFHALRNPECTRAPRPPEDGPKKKKKGQEAESPPSKKPKKKNNKGPRGATPTKQEAPPPKKKCADRGWGMDYGAAALLSSGMLLSCAAAAPAAE